MISWVWLILTSNPFAYRWNHLTVQLLKRKTLYCAREGEKIGSRRFFDIYIEGVYCFSLKSRVRGELRLYIAFIPQTGEEPGAESGTESDGVRD